MAYYTSNEEHPIDILNIKGLEAKVKARMAPGAFGYIREGAEDEWTMRENTRSFEDKHIRPPPRSTLFPCSTLFRSQELPYTAVRTYRLLKYSRSFLPLHSLNTSCLLQDSVLYNCW